MFPDDGYVPTAQSTLEVRDPRYFFTMQFLGIDLSGSKLAFQYAEEFIRVINLLISVVEEYPAINRFSALNCALAEFPLYKNFLETRINSFATAPLTPVQLQRCVSDLTANVSPQDLQVLDTAVQHIRTISFYAPHSVEANANFSKLRAFFTHCADAMEVIKGSGLWRLEMGDAILQDLHSHIAEILDRKTSLRKTN